MMIRASETSLRIFNTETVLKDPVYKDHMHDQVYFNVRMKHQARYRVLPQALFPNGSPYSSTHDPDPSKYPPPKAPYIIHFNYFPGQTKIEAMKQRGHWYLDEDDEENSKEVGNELILLHVGGQQRKQGWTTIDISEHHAADVIAPMDDLNMYDDASVTAVYASHVLEHASYKQSGDMRRDKGEETEKGKGEGLNLGMFSGSEVARALSEWRRVLKPGGLLFIAVPDLPTIAQLYVNGETFMRKFNINCC
jgi:hypothetical protein